MTQSFEYFPPRPPAQPPYPPPPNPQSTWQQPPAEPPTSGSEWQQPPTDQPEPVVGSDSGQEPMPADPPAAEPTLEEPLVAAHDETPPPAYQQSSDRPAEIAPDPRGDDARDALTRLRSEVAKVVIGQDATVTGLVIALLCRGHVLLEGVPGVAKTLLVRTLSHTLRLDHKRVQFTPDLMPGDVTGSLIYDARTAEFSFRAGPVFTNLLLADEINRTPPKTQASLAAGGHGGADRVRRRRVPPAAGPVCGVRDPEPDRIRGHLPAARGAAGPFPAQADRAAAQPGRRNPGRAGAQRRLRPAGPAAAAGVQQVAGADDLAAAREAVRKVQIADPVLGYVVDICRQTRSSPSLSLGASPRGATALLGTAKAWAWLSGRGYVTPDDVKALARPTLRHRVAVRPEAELEGVTADGVLDTVLASVPAPR